MKAFVRYLAVNTKQPEAMADYYKHYFGLDEVVRSKNGDIALSDGWFKLCLLAEWPDDEIAGMSHYGLAIDGLDALQARLRRFGPHADIGAGRGGDFHGDYFVLDPQGMPWAISTRDFGMSGAPKPFGVPRIRHAELSVGDTHREMQWMIDVFGLREINCSKKIRDAGSKFAIRMLGDGVINVTFLPFDHVHPKVMSARQTERKWAVQHFGWVVPDMMGLIESLPEKLRDPTPSTGNMAEFQALDPDENRFDLSQTKGFEVDFDIWERGDGPGGPPASIRMPPGGQ
jgi:Glyoxalase/Bleomycin resistance protein/Dioxygenase superfamily